MYLFCDSICRTYWTSLPIHHLPPEKAEPKTKQAFKEPSVHRKSQTKLTHVNIWVFVMCLGEVDKRRQISGAWSS